MWSSSSRARSRPCEARKRRANTTVDRPVEPERMRRDEPHDLLPESVRVPQAAHDAPGDAGAELRVVAVVRVRLGLRRGRGTAPSAARGATRPRPPRSARRRTCARRAGPAAVPSRGRSRSPPRTRGRPRRARPCRGRSGGRRAAGPRAAASTAPPSRRPRARRRSARRRRGADRAASARICATVSAGSVNPSCETSRRPRRMRSGSSRKLSAETVRSSRRSRSATPSNGSTISPVSRRFGDGVHGEVATRHVVLDRDRPVGDDLEVAVPRSRAALGARRRQLDAGRHQPADLAVTRVEAHADELAVHLHVLDPAVRLERRPQPGLVDARDEEVLVGVLDPEELVANGAADDVGVEPERADVTADRGRHEPDCRVSRGTRSSTGARRPRSRRARPTGAWRPGTSTAPAAGRPRGSCTRRSSPGSRRGRRGRRSS